MSGKYFRSKPVPKKAHSKRLDEAYENQIKSNGLQGKTFEEALRGLPKFINNLQAIQTGRMRVTPDNVLENSAIAIQRQADNVLIQGQRAREIMQEELGKLADEFKRIGKSLTIDPEMIGVPSKVRAQEAVLGDEALLNINNLGLKCVIGYDKARNEDLSVTGYYRFNPETFKYDPIWTERHTNGLLTEGIYDQMLLAHVLKEAGTDSWTAKLKKQAIELGTKAWEKQDFSKLSSQAREKVQSAMKNDALDSFKTFMEEYIKSWIEIPENRYYKHISEELDAVLSKPMKPIMIDSLDHEFDPVLQDRSSMSDMMMRYERFGFVCMHQPVQGVVTLSAESTKELLKTLKEEKEDGES